MAYVDQTKKAKIAATLKTIMPKGWKYSLAVENHSTIRLTIAQAPVNLLAEMARVHNTKHHLVAQHCEAKQTDHSGVNHYYLDDAFDGDLLVLFKKIVAALNTDNFDKSDIMTDYFHVGHYVDIQIGRWNKPFVVAA